MEGFYPAVTATAEFKILNKAGQPTDKIDLETGVVTLIEDPTVISELTAEKTGVGTYKITAKAGNIGKTTVSVRVDGNDLPGADNVRDMIASAELEVVRDATNDAATLSTLNFTVTPQTPASP